MPGTLCQGALKLCSESTLECTIARKIKRPWTKDLKGVLTQDTCCYEVYQKKRFKGEKFKVEAAYGGIKWLDYAVKSAKIIEC